MVKTFIGLGVVAGAFWILSAWMLVDTLVGDRLPHDTKAVRHRVEAAKDGKYLSPEQLAECQYGQTVAVRGKVTQVGKTSDSHAFVVVNGVVCRMIQFLPPKCQPEQEVVVAGRWDGRGLCESAVY